MCMRQVEPVSLAWKTQAKSIQPTKSSLSSQAINQHYNETSSTSKEGTLGRLEPGIECLFNAQYAPKKPLNYVPNLFTKVCIEYLVFNPIHKKHRKDNREVKLNQFNRIRWLDRFAHWYGLKALSYISCHFFRLTLLW